jgi:NADH dehydrogenase|uniref:NADH:ubiquinone reductase (non-electrogenic) n=1 Tax=Mesoaciditoga lauensis TaxID=1495039 RepID=A0A7V3RFD8_9BACT
MGKKIIVLGGGFAGVEAIQKLVKYLSKDDAEITLMEKDDAQTFRTELHKFACERIDLNAARFPLEKIIDTKRVDIVKGEAKKVDIKNKKIVSGSKEYGYDFLVLAFGSEPNFFGIPGMKENALSFWTLEDAKKINDHVKRCFSDVKKVKDANERQKMLTFVVGGGGFTGVEMMGELMRWVDKLCRTYLVDRKEIKLMIVEALPRILPNISKDSAVQKAIKYMKKYGVEVKTNSMITNVSKDGLTLKSGESIPTNTLIWSGGVQGNSFSSQIDLNKDKRGRIVVNEYMESSDPSVYAIGDIASYVDKSNKPMPGLVESAMQSADVAASNVASQIKGGQKKSLDLKLHGNIVYIGKSYGVANINGLGNFGGYIAIPMKHLVNIQHSFHVGGFGMVFKYLGDQIF